LPSTTLEGFGLVVVEALACGTPVIATDRCAPPEILRPLDERLVVRPDDIHAMAEALLAVGGSVAADPAFRTRCRTFVCDHFTWARTAAELEQAVLHARQAKASPATP
jgi:glycosyltransferase involved in cell wall biosynthesis